MLDKLDDEKMLEDFDRWFVRIVTPLLLIAMGAILGYAWAYFHFGPKIYG